MKSKVIIALVVVLAIIGIAVMRSHSREIKLQPVETSVSGVVKSVATSAKLILVTTTDEQEITLALDPTSKLYDESGSEIGLVDIKAGMSVHAVGTTTPTSVIPESVTIVSRPPEDAGIGDPCPGVISEENSSITCRISTGSRITITLPSASYSKSSLSISPSDTISETFGASTQNDRWIRTFEAVKPGKVTITVPSKNKAVSAFKAVLDIYGEAPAPQDITVPETAVPDEAAGQ